MSFKTLRQYIANKSPDKVQYVTESSKGEMKATIIGLPRLKDFAKMVAEVEKLTTKLEQLPTAKSAIKFRLINNLKELHAMLSSGRIDPSEVDILQNEIIRDINLV